MSKIVKIKKLEKLYGEMEFLRGKLEICASCKNFVKGTGDVDSKILFVGEAPGRDEDLQGEPFVGRSGKLFIKILEENNFLRKEIFITNIVKCRPPENRDPSIEEISLFSKILKQEVEILNPKIIVTLGRISLGFFLENVKFKNQNTKEIVEIMDLKNKKDNHNELSLQKNFLNFKISDLHGKFFKISKNRFLFPMYHPSFALRGRKNLESFRKDFEIFSKDFLKIYEKI